MGLAISKTLPRNETLFIVKAHIKYKKLNWIYWGRNYCNDDHINQKTDGYRCY